MTMLERFLMGLGVLVLNMSFVYIVVHLLVHGETAHATS